MTTPPPEPSWGSPTPLCAESVERFAAHDSGTVGGNYFSTGAGPLRRARVNTPDWSGAWLGKLLTYEDYQ